MSFSNFHKMVNTVMKMSFKKDTIEITNILVGLNLNNSLNEKLSESVSNCESFEATFIEVLNKHAPLRKELLRANDAPYITETLRKAIMGRSQLETKYLKIKAQTDLKLYKKHKNVCSKLYKKKEENIMSPYV